MLVAAASLALIAATTQGEPAKLMVMDVTANDVTPVFADTVTELVAVELSRYQPLDVASGSDVRQLLQLEASKEMASCDDETSCMVAVAGALGAELIVHGKAAKLGETTLVTLHLFDVGAGKALSRTSFQVKSPDELPARVKAAVDQLASSSLSARGIKSAGAATVQAPPATPTTPSAPEKAPPEKASPEKASSSASLADLEALAKSKAWKELLARALDVPPAQRQKRWNELVAQAAAQGLEKARQREPYEALTLDEQLSDLFPTALQQPAYAAVRTVAMREGFEACFARANAAARRFVADRASIPDCARLAEAYAERADISSAEAAGLAKLVRRHRHPSVAVALFSRAVPDKGSATCTDPDLAMAVVSALYEKPEDPLAIEAKSLAFDRCFQALKDPIKKELARAGARRFFLNACPDMLRRGGLGKLQTKRCQRRLASAEE